MYKVYRCIIGLLFFSFFFLVSGQDVNASDKVNYISNRIKIVRPEKVEKVPDMEVAKKPDIDISLPDAGKDDAGTKKEGQMDEVPISQEFASLLGMKGKYYSRKGRVDPFAPFLRKPAPKVKKGPRDVLQRREPRTPLEKIDLSQLRLTGIMQIPDKNTALVQESSGKGYVVSEGTWIGNKGGQVIKIIKDRIVVEEKYLDVYGKISVRKRELKLRP